jgi:hypothetical protein
MPSLTPRSTNRIPVAGGASFGISTFAGLMLMLSGAFHVVLSIGALNNGRNSVFVQTSYTYNMNLTAWGWLHLLLGVAAVLVGIGIMLGKSWAFILGLVVAVLSALENFAFLPQEPVWSAMMLAFDAIVIWALTAELREPQ